MSNLIIRPYAVKDRSDVRRICCDAADRGGPIENFFPDREFAAFLLTAYYTDYEPSASFVAESDGKVVGYIQGCLDNRRYGLVMIFILLPIAVVKGLSRGVFFLPEAHQMVIGMFKNWPRLFVWRKKSFHSHQGHFHIGIDGAYRGQGTGKLLVDVLLKHAASEHAHELAASVHSANTAACRFFEHCGFTARERHDMVMARGNQLEHYQSVLYVKAVH